MSRSIHRALESLSVAEFCHMGVQGFGEPVLRLFAFAMPLEFVDIQGLTEDDRDSLQPP